MQGRQDIREGLFSIGEPGRHGIADVQELVGELWEDLRIVGTAANAEAAAAGIEVGELPGSMAGFLELKPAAAGVTGVDLLVVGAGHVAWGLWIHVLLPQIRARWGDTALQAKAAREKAAARKEAADAAAARKAAPARAPAGKRARKRSDAAPE